MPRAPPRAQYTVSHATAWAVCPHAARVTIRRTGQRTVPWPPVRPACVIVS